MADDADDKNGFSSAVPVPHGNHLTVYTTNVAKSFFCHRPCDVIADVIADAMHLGCHWRRRECGEERSNEPIAAMGNHRTPSMPYQQPVTWKKHTVLD
jgi:hypothetical protein